MKNMNEIWIKENWFKIGIILTLAVLGSGSLLVWSNSNQEKYILARTQECQSLVREKSDDLAKETEKERSFHDVAIYVQEKAGYNQETEQCIYAYYHRGLLGPEYIIEDLMLSEQLFYEGLIEDDKRAEAVQRFKETYENLLGIR